MQPTNPTSSRVNANSYTQASSSRARPPGGSGSAHHHRHSQAPLHPPNPAYLHVDPPPRSDNDSPFYSSRTRPVKAPLPTAAEARREGRKRKVVHKGACAIHETGECAKKAQRELTSAVEKLPAHTAKAAEWAAQVVEECVEAAAELGAEAWGSEVAKEVRARAKTFAEDLKVLRARAVVAGRKARGLVHDVMLVVRKGREDFGQVRRLRAQRSLAAVLLEASFEDGS